MVGRWVLAALGVGAGIASGLAMAAAGAPRTRERFKLSEALEARAAAHRELVANAGRSAEDFCKLATDTIELLNPIETELLTFGGDQHHSPPFSAVQRAYADTAKSVPGLHLDVFEEGFRTGIDYLVRRTRLPPRCPSRPP